MRTGSNSFKGAPAPHGRSSSPKVYRGSSIGEQSRLHSPTRLVSAVFLTRQSACLALAPPTEKRNSSIDRGTRPEMLLPHSPGVALLHFSKTGSIHLLVSSEGPRPHQLRQTERALTRRTV